ncbi:hypothetical protein [Zhihengliuella halotolerans]|uniref:hypothetical protein n=1 Tax=Zhihengliuella halotolerans TaxID=370736 RepID=UPI000C80D99E|nr:hypothetical protein [Zhihengliuella halotolerans]
MDENEITVAVLIAVIGLAGVVLGGIIQTLTQRWIVRHDRMTELRKTAAEFVEAASSYGSILVQSAVMIDEVRADYLNRVADNPEAEIEVDQEYLERLGGEFFKTFSSVQRLSVHLMASSDHRISAQAMKTRLHIVRIQNSVGLIHTGTIQIPGDKAKSIQLEINEQANILLNMISPSRLERYREFRGVRAAKRRLAREHKREQTRHE